MLIQRQSVIDKCAQHRKHEDAHRLISNTNISDIRFSVFKKKLKHEFCGKNYEKTQEDSQFIIVFFVFKIFSVSR